MTAYRLRPYNRSLWARPHNGRLRAHEISLTTACDRPRTIKRPQPRPV